ncbi:hypothetical protein BDV93DRAFT_436335, partial [Ceratobasidium sp. AG-I]
VGWHDPADGGGRMLDYTTIFYGEPLNVIISGASHPDVLTHDGLHKYAKSIGFSEECLGIHIGDLHAADLGDGEGRKDEQFLARQHYFPIWGTCWESLAGGNHFRAWNQQDTGAWFLAYVACDHHQIIDDGYNIGRDYLVARAVRKGAIVEWRDDLLVEGDEGTLILTLIVWCAGINHGIAQDGKVAVLTIDYAP